MASYPRVDEVVDRRDLRRDVLTGRDDLELLELRGDLRLCRVGLRVLIIWMRHVLAM
jgi:hypothetical protein